MSKRRQGCCCFPGFIEAWCVPKPFDNDSIPIYAVNHMVKQGRIHGWTVACDWAEAVMPESHNKMINQTLLLTDRRTDGRTEVIGYFVLTFISLSNFSLYSFSLNMISSLNLSLRCIAVTWICTSLIWKWIPWWWLKAMSTSSTWRRNSIPPPSISASPNGETSTSHHLSAETLSRVSRNAVTDSWTLEVEQLSLVFWLTKFNSHKFMDLEINRTVWLQLGHRWVKCN